MFKEKETFCSERPELALGTREMSRKSHWWAPCTGEENPPNTLNGDNPRDWQCSNPQGPCTGPQEPLVPEVASVPVLSLGSMTFGRAVLGTALCGGAFLASTHGTVT